MKFAKIHKSGEGAGLGQTHIKIKHNNVKQVMKVVQIQWYLCKNKNFCFLILDTLSVVYTSFVT